MQGAFFKNCEFGRRSHFTECDMTDAKFENCNMGEGIDPIIFTKCTLDNTEMDFPNAKGNNVSEIIFKDTSMKNTNMSTCDFSRAKVILDNCDTKDLIVKGCKVKELDTDLKTRSYFIANGGEVKDMTTSEKVVSFICSNSPFDVSSLFC